MTGAPAPWRHQTEAADFAEDKRGVMLAMEMGTGKPLGDDTPIPTPGGWTRMGGVRPGQTLLDENGNPCSVLAVYPQGVRPVSAVSLDDGSELVAGDEHLWVTMSGREDQSGAPGPGWALGRDPVTTMEIAASLAEAHRIPSAGDGPARLITGVTPRGPASATCITVDSPSGLFLAGEGMVPTHNTKIAIDLIHRKKHKRILVLCPLSIVDYVWPQQVATHQQGPIMVVPLGARLNGVKAKKAAAEKAMRRVRDHTTLMVVVNYESSWREPLASWIASQKWDLLVMDECHPAGTRIATPSGPRKIQELREGDTVWGVDHRSGKVVRTEVTHTFQRDNKEELVAVGNTRMTPEHPVWTARGYVNAADVSGCDRICRLEEEAGNAAQPDLRMVPVPVLGIQKDQKVLRQTVRWESLQPNGKGQGETARRKTHRLTCRQCRTEFMGDSPNRQFCSRSCRAGSRARTEQARERSRQNMKQLWETAEFRESTTRRLESESNPLKDPVNRARSIRANRERGFSHLNGGNGTGLTQPQRKIAEWLGWPTEYPVGTGKREPGKPTHYKIDIANPDLKIAIEVDGQSHKTRKTREADTRKDTFLQEKGWLMLRILNEQVTNNEETVRSLIKSSISRREREITSRKDSSSTTPTS